MTSVLVQMGVDSLTSVDRRSFVPPGMDGVGDVTGNEAAANDEKGRLCSAETGPKTY